MARAPGRVNLMGDHTDHSGGLCLPMAVDRWVEVSGWDRAELPVVRLRSDATGTVAEVPLDVADASTVEPEWGRYLAGVVQQLQRRHGFEGTVRSTVPMGAGLSSSAALELAVALALGAPADDRLRLAQLAQAAEHAARAVPTGLLDQLAVAFGVAGHALLIDCSTNEVTPSPLPGGDELEVVVVPGPSRSLAATPYATRVAEVRRAEAEVGPLARADLDGVERIADPVVRARARHVVTENQRVLHLAALLAAGQLDQAGAVMDDSHRSLRDDFGSSTPERDRTWESVRAQPGVYGARITGAGWGGSLVALARPGAIAGRGHVVQAVDGARTDGV